MCSKSLLSCPLCCQSIFPNIDSLKRNLIKVNSKPIKCPFSYCDEVLLGLDKLTIHLFSHSMLSDNEDDLGKAIPHRKDEKKKPTTNRKQNRNPRKPKSNRSTPSIHSNDTGSCDSTVSLPFHLSNNKEHKCEFCGFTFKDKALLDMHLNLVHNVDPNEEPNEDNIFIKQEPLDSGKQRLKCHLCLKSFKMKGSLRIHMRVAHIGFQDMNEEKLNICDYLKRQMIVSEPPSIHPSMTQDIQVTPTNTFTSFSQRFSENDYYSNQTTVAPIPTTSSISTTVTSFCDPNDNNSNPKSNSVNDNNSKSNNNLGKSWECDVCLKVFTTKCKIFRSKQRNVLLIFSLL